MCTHRLFVDHRCINDFICVLVVGLNLEIILTAKFARTTVYSIIVAILL